MQRAVACAVEDGVYVTEGHSKRGAVPSNAVNSAPEHDIGNPVAISLGGGGCLFPQDCLWLEVVSRGTVVRLCNGAAQGLR
jgi:hypothetical protein